MKLRVIPVLLLALACSRGEYRELRRLFADSAQLFRDYGRELNAATSPEQATLVMRDYNGRVEQLIARKEEVLGGYPELQDMKRLRQTCERLDEFQTFRADFSDFYRGGDRIARKFGHDKAFQAESKRGRKLITRML